MTLTRAQKAREDEEDTQLQLALKRSKAETERAEAKQGATMKARKGRRHTENDSKVRKAATKIKKSQQSVKTKGRTEVNKSFVQAKPGTPPSKLTQQGTDVSTHFGLSKVSRATQRINVAKNREVKPSLKVVLPLNYRNVSYAQIRYYELKKRKFTQGFWPYAPKYRGMKLGYDYFAHLNFKKPEETEVRQRHKELVRYAKGYDHESYVDMPAHAAQEKFDVDVVIQIMFSQATGNEIAIDTHSRLCNSFPYMVERKKHVGKTPNWHDVRLLSEGEFTKMLRQGGFQSARARNILTLLNNAYNTNLERKEKGLQHFEHDMNTPGAKDFEPGMLSLDYMMDYESNSDDAILGRLLQIQGIGVKSAMCIMAFALKRPIFVVDVHVMRVCKWLGWLPEECTSLGQAACYLHAIIPDDIKYDLHNQIWTHCANENNRESKTRTVICAVCGSNPPARTRDISKYLKECPLQLFIPPMSERWQKKYRDADTELEDAGEQEGVDANKPVSSDTETSKKQGTSKRTKQSQEQSRKKRTVQNTTLSVFSKPDSITPTWNSEEETAIEPAQSPRPWKEVTRNAKRLAYEILGFDMEPEEPEKVKKIDLEKGSHRWEDIDESQYEVLFAAGYLLFEFRPMDNSFSAEWGTFDKLPRYRWEKPGIMDPDVAVSVEYVTAVLAGKQEHKWSRNNLSALDITATQTVSTMTE